jgi:transcriptional regulator with XRE-family HTH domain
MNRLKELRKSKNWNQEDVAELIGSNKNTISRYESGKREPEYKTLKKLAEIFNVSTDYLLETSDILIEENQIKKPTEISELTEQELFILRAYKGASPEWKAAVEAVLESAERARLSQDSGVADE